MEEKITIAAVGDIFMGRRVEVTSTKKENGYIFALVRPLMQGNDIVFGNLESPISNLETTGNGLIAKPAALDELKEVGFNAVSIANNHIMDFGLPALQDTINALKDKDIGFAGAGFSKTDAWQPLKKVGGKNVTLLAYYGMGGSTWSGKGGYNSGDASKILKDIQTAREETDIILVAMHWGRGGGLPMKHQVEFAHQMIDTGAKVILGSGPHILQPVELYNDGVIAYSLGNFVFDHLVEKRRQTMILHISLKDSKIESVDITPILIDEYRPQPIDPDTSPEIYNHIQSLLVHELNKFESDANIIPLGEKNLIRRGLTKLIRSDQRAYPLSFYLRGVLELLKKKLLSKN